MSFPQLFLKRQNERRLRRGHLWIYSNEVDTQKNPLTAFEIGDQVEVVSASGQSLGLAVLNPHNLICGRLISRKTKYGLGGALFRHRIKNALALREQVFDGPYYRLVYGDSDFLPGVVIDRFGEDVVVQIASAGVEQHKDKLLDALSDILKPRSILLQNDHSARELEKLPLYTDVIGNAPEQLQLIENGTSFVVPAQGGQKTGWFYDHRSNRAELQKWVKGKRVLDVFSYVGGWGVQMAKAGADHVVCVDASEQALNFLEKNAELNQCDERMEAIQGKALDVLKMLIEEGEKFDVVVLDPPAFIKRKKDQKSGEAAYRHHNELAIRLLTAGGILVSGSCSMHLAGETLTDIVRGASTHLDRDCQLLYCGSQGADHPVHPAIPETQYLKAQFFRLLSRG